MVFGDDVLRFYIEYERTTLDRERESVCNDDIKKKRQQDAFCSNNNKLIII